MPAIKILSGTTDAEVTAAFAGQTYPVNVLIYSTGDDKSKLPNAVGIIEPPLNSVLNKHEPSMVVSVASQAELLQIAANAKLIAKDFDSISDGIVIETTLRAVSGWTPKYFDDGDNVFPTLAAAGSAAEWYAKNRDAPIVVNGVIYVSKNGEWISNKSLSVKNSRKRLGASTDSFGLRDAITTGGTPPVTQTSVMSILRAANVVMRQSLELVDLTGISGSQIIDGPGSVGFLSRLPSVLAKQVDYVYLPATVNNDKDSVPLTVNDEIGYYKQAFDMCFASGVTPITTTKFPSSFTNSPEEYTAIGVWNNWVLGECRRNSIIVCDVSAACADTTSLSYQVNPNCVEKTGGVISNANVHRNAAGTILDGKAIARDLGAVIEPWQIPWIYTYDATNPTARNGAIKNPIMVGTSGTVNSPASGQCATNWTIGANAGDTLVASKVSRNDGALGEWQQFVWTPAAANTQTVMSTAGSGQRIGLGDKIAGVDSVEYLIEFEIDDTNINIVRNWYFQATFYDASVTSLGQAIFNGDYANSAVDVVFGHLSGIKGVLATPKVLIPANTTNVAIAIGVRSFSNGQPITFRVGRITYV